MKKKTVHVCLTNDEISHDVKEKKNAKHKIILSTERPTLKKRKNTQYSNKDDRWQDTTFGVTPRLREWHKYWIPGPTRYF